MLISEPLISTYWNFRSSAAAIVWAGGLFLKFLTGISREGVLIAVGLLVGIVVIQAAWNRLLQLDR